MSKKERKKAKKVNKKKRKKGKKVNKKEKNTKKWMYEDTVKVGKDL